MNSSTWNQNRGIIRRVFVSGKLILETPAHLGGEGTSLTDMPLLLDPEDQRALLMGSSVAGALRSYLRQREMGFRTRSSAGSLDNQLFGGLEDSEGDQSYLVVYDSLSEGGKPGIEMRDGVMINAHTRTAEDKKKYDYELLQAGLSFELRFELLLTLENQAELINAFCVALEGLERGEIPLGGRKHRGFGKCRVSEWVVNDYQMTNIVGLAAWLKNDRSGNKRGAKLSELLNPTRTVDARNSLEISGKFRLRGPLLIRSGLGDSKAPDVSHLHSLRNGTMTPVISGTSIGGVLRGHALRIAKTLNLDNADLLVEGIFGPTLEDKDDDACASRIWIDECELAPGAEWVQNRVKIDRFTGGSYPTALFNEQPYFPADDELELKIRLENPEEKEIGLLLLALKDLWLEDLPLGGEIGVGRGRLSGKKLHIRLKNPAGLDEWEISAGEDGKLNITGSPAKLEAYVSELREVKNG